MLTGCAVDLNAPKSTYARAGVYKDRYDFNYYNYAELGKSIPVSENGSVNASVGLINLGSNHLVEVDETIENYWEVNYEYRW